MSNGIFLMFILNLREYLNMIQLKGDNSKLMKFAFLINSCSEKRVANNRFMVNGALCFEMHDDKAVLDWMKIKPIL